MISCSDPTHEGEERQRRVYYSRSEDFCPYGLKEKSKSLGTLLPHLQSEIPNIHLLWRAKCPGKRWPSGSDLTIHGTENGAPAKLLSSDRATELSALGEGCFLLRGEPFRCFVGIAEDRGYCTAQRLKGIELEVSILYHRHKLLTRHRHFPFWSSPYHGESFYFLNDILIG